MNYLAEIKAFQGFVQDKQLSTGQIALWYALMYINNKCAWTEWFTVANLSLELNSGLSRQGIVKARNVLKQVGLIDFKSNGTKATSYKIVPHCITSNSVQDSIQFGVQDSIQNSVQIGVQSSSTLNKLDKTKLNKTKQNVVVESKPKSFSAIDFDNTTTTTLIKYFVENIDPRANPVNVEMICSWLDIFDENIIIKAIDEAIKAGNDKRNTKYINAILNNWQNKGLTTLSTVQGYLDDWENKKNNATNTSKFTKQLEAIKEWQPKE